MAETKPSGAVRPQSLIRQRTTPSGVTHIREYQPDRFTIIGNHLAQHRELSLTAIGLGTHILSLPEGASTDIRTLAECFPEGRDRIAFALRELEAHGHIERVRERVEGGRVITRTYAYNAPALTRAHGAAADGAVATVVEPEPVHGAPTGPVAPLDAVPSAVSAAPVAKDEVPKDEVRDVVPVRPAQEPAEPQPSSCEHCDKAVALLVGLRRTDDRFTLSQRDVCRLAPAVIAWFDNGVGGTAVHHALTADVPTLLKNPAGFLAHRLRELLPPPLPPLPDIPEASAPGVEPSPSYWMVDCAGGCDRAFRQPEGTWCRDCRAERDRSAEGDRRISYETAGAESDRAA
ncbi:helix-turn-helix domain-containing protein [Streptomyces sp. NPDC002643]